MAQRAPVHSPGKIGRVKTYTPVPPEHKSTFAKGYNGPKWERLRRETFLRDGYRCQSCERLCVEKSRDWRERPHCDHVIPKPQGSDTLDNLQTLCGSCHSSKTDRIDRPGKAARP